MARHGRRPRGDLPPPPIDSSANLSLCRYSAEAQLDPHIAEEPAAHPDAGRDQGGGRGPRAEDRPVGEQRRQHRRGRRRRDTPGVPAQRGQRRPRRARAPGRRRRRRPRALAHSRYAPRLTPRLPPSRLTHPPRPLFRENRGHPRGQPVRGAPGPGGAAPEPQERELRRAHRRHGRADAARLGHHDDLQPPGEPAGGPGHLREPRGAGAVRHAHRARWRRRRRRARGGGRRPAGARGGPRRRLADPRRPRQAGRPRQPAGEPPRLGNYRLSPRLRSAPRRNDLNRVTVHRACRATSSRRASTGRPAPRRPRAGAPPRCPTRR